jgi:hypothetical protein
LGGYSAAPHLFFDPCQLAWQVKQFGKLEGALRASFFDPCQLAWQVKQFGRLLCVPQPLNSFTCRVSRQGLKRD